MYFCQTCRSPFRFATPEELQQHLKDCVGLSENEEVKTAQCPICCLQFLEDELDDHFVCCQTEAQLNDELDALGTTTILDEMLGPSTSNGTINGENGSAVPIAILPPLPAAPMEISPETKAILDMLIARSVINLRQPYAFQTWCKSAESLFVKASTLYRTGAYQDSFIAYRKFCRIVTEVLPTHKDIHKFRTDSSYTKLTKIAAVRAIPRLERLKRIINGEKLQPEDPEIILKDETIFERGLTVPQTLTTLQVPGQSTATLELSSIAANELANSSSSTARPRSYAAHNMTAFAANLRARPVSPEFKDHPANDSTAPPHSSPLVLPKPNKLNVPAVTSRDRNKSSPPMMTDSQQAANPDFNDTVKDSRSLSLDNNNMKVIAQVEAIYEFTASRSDELSIVKNEVLTLLEHPSNDSEWCMAKTATGHMGFVPRTYTQPLSSKSNAENELLPSDTTLTSTFSLKRRMIGAAVTTRPALPPPLIIASPVPSTSSTTMSPPPSTASSHSSSTEHRSSFAVTEVSTTRPVLFRAVAIQDYEAKDKGELSLKQNEIIDVVAAPDAFPAFFLAISGDQKGPNPRPEQKGLVPRSYVLKLENPSDKTARPTSMVHKFGSFLKFGSRKNETDHSAALSPTQDPPSRLDQHQPVHAVAMYDYEATDTEQMSISVGDQLEVFFVGDDGWANATKLSNGKSGLVPMSYVQQKEPANPVVSPPAAPSVTLKHKSPKLSKRLSKLSNIAGKTSSFFSPADVSVKSPESKPAELPVEPAAPPAATAADTPQKGARAVALYDYVSRSTDDITFQEGDLFEILDVDQDWYHARRISDNVQGFVPVSYLRIEAEQATSKTADNSQQTNLSNLMSFKTKWTALVGSEVAANCTAWKRQVAIFELYETWNSFVAELDDIVTKIVEPLRERGLLTQDEFIDLFSNIEDVRQISHDLANDLHKRIAIESKYLVDRCGDVLLKRFEQFQVYAAYCSNISRATSIVELNNNDDFDDFLHSVNSNPMLLTTMISKPLFRITKLELQVKAVVKESDEEDSDYWDLKHAQAAIEDVCIYINRVHHATSDIVRKDLSKSNLIDPLFLAPSRRRLVFCGSVSLNIRNVKERDAFALLYDDCLIFAFLKKEESFFSKGDRRQGDRRHNYRMKIQPLFLELIDFKDDVEKTGFVITHSTTGETYNVNTAEVKKSVHWLKQIKLARAAKIRSRIFCLREVFPSTPKTSVYSCAERESPANDGQMYVIATDNGVFVRRQVDTAWIQLLGARRKVSQVGFLEQMLVTIESANVAMSYPVSCLHPNFLTNEVKGNPLEGSKNAVSFEFPSPSTAVDLSVLTNNSIQLYSLQIKQQQCQKLKQYNIANAVSHHVLAEVIIVATLDKFYRINRGSSVIDEIVVPPDLPPSQPLMAIPIERCILLCYQHYGIVFTDDLSYAFTRVSWSKATSINCIYPYLLVAHADERYIEIRDVRHIWPILQILSCRNPLLCFGPDGLVITEDDKERVVRKLQFLI